MLRLAFDLLHKLGRRAANFALLFCVGYIWTRPWEIYPEQEKLHHRPAFTWSSLVHKQDCMAGYVTCFSMLWKYWDRRREERRNIKAYKSIGSRGAGLPRDVMDTNLVAGRGENSELSFVSVRVAQSTTSLLLCSVRYFLYRRLEMYECLQTKQSITWTNQNINEKKFIMLKLNWLLS